jgi:hypothetical protein
MMDEAKDLTRRTTPRPPMARAGFAWREHAPLLLLMAAAWGLRVILLLRGGQNYFPDESRYFRTFQLISHVTHGDFGGGLNFFLEQPDHNAFILLAGPAAMAQYLLTKLLGVPWESMERLVWVASLYFSLASVACIGLIYALALRVGADKREALVAAFLFACSNTMFYYSRHLLPYDLSLALALLSLWVGLDPRPSILRSVICGTLAGLAFMTYNGHWLLGVVALVVHVLVVGKSIRRFLQAGISAVLAFVDWPALMTAASIARGTKPFVQAMMDFGAADKQQGYPPEGWALPWEYFWHSEHGLLLVWGIGLAVLAWFVLRRSPIFQGRGALWLGLAVGCYVVMAFASTGPLQYTVKGRIARQLVPFFSLATACAFTGLAQLKQWKRGFAIIGATAIAGQALLNFIQPARLHFPEDFRRRVTQVFGEARPDLTVQGPPIEGKDEVTQPTKYVLLNAQYLTSPILGPKPPPPGEVVWKVAHPTEYRAFTYEGYTPAERSVLRSVDISMRLIDTAEAMGLYRSP